MDFIIPSATVLFYLNQFHDSAQDREKCCEGMVKIFLLTQGFLQTFLCPSQWEKL